MERRRSVLSNLGSNPKQQSLPRQPARRVRSNLFVPCPPAIADQFPEPLRKIANAGGRVPVSPCVHSSPAGVRLRRVLGDPEARVDREAGDPLDSVQERCHLALARDRALRGVLECFRRCRTA